MIWFVGPAWVPLSPAIEHGRALPPVGTHVAPASARPLKSAPWPPAGPGVGVTVARQMTGGIAIGGLDFGAGPGVFVAVGHSVGVGVVVTVAGVGVGVRVAVGWLPMQSALFCASCDQCTTNVLLTYVGTACAGPDGVGVWMIVSGVFDALPT